MEAQQQSNKPSFDNTDDTGPDSLREMLDSIMQFSANNIGEDIHDMPKDEQARILLEELDSNKPGVVETVSGDSSSSASPLSAPPSNRRYLVTAIPYEVLDTHIPNALLHIVGNRAIESNTKKLLVQYFFSLYRPWLYKAKGSEHAVRYWGPKTLVDGPTLASLYNDQLKQL